jgi:hypothetical protein
VYRLLQFQKRRQLSSARITNRFPSSRYASIAEHKDDFKAGERYYMKKRTTMVKHDRSLLWLVDCFSDYSAPLRH